MKNLCAIFVVAFLSIGPVACGGSSCDDECTRANAACDGPATECGTFCSELDTVAEAAECVAERDSAVECQADLDDEAICNANENACLAAFINCVTPYCAANPAECQALSSSP